MARKTAEPPELTDLETALRAFAFPSAITQSGEHIRKLHWYTACRLVIEGGFDPAAVLPRPPLVVEKRGKRYLLHHDPGAARGGERVVLGGLKTKNIDVTVALQGIGPVLAVSLKGTHNAFRNLTNRMEEAAGDCTNLHLSYPALVYGFWNLIRANEEEDEAPDTHFQLGDDGRYRSNDWAITAGGSLAEGVARYAHALERLSGREDLRDHPSSYEACAITLVKCRGGRSHCRVHSVYPVVDDVLEFNRMFRDLYGSYDLRYVFQAPALARRTARHRWDPASPVLVDTVLSSPAFREMTPRLS